MSFISFLQNAAAQAGQPQAIPGGAPSQSSTMSLLSTIVPFLIIILIFYFFMIRPQNKKQKELEKMISSLKKGDKIVTIGGIHGVVSSTKEKTVIVKVDDNTKVEFSRSAIASVESDKVLDDASKKTDKKVAETESNEKSEKETEIK